jgi:succinate dehydrogenase/fumarate reductase cytochrome b subunit (b558 family)
MTATVPANARSSLASFYDSVIGKKVVMAVTGLILFGFVVVHMLGNLQIYLGPQAINRYAELLRVSPGLLWGARLVLLGAVGLHILTALQLAKRKMDARPQGYQKYTPTTSSYASRTMLWSGPILAAFIVYHLLHLTVGSAHGDFREMQVYWDKHRFDMKLVNPANKRKYSVIVVGTGLAGGGGGGDAGRAGLQRQVLLLPGQPAPRPQHRRAGRHQRRQELPERRRQHLPAVLRHGQGRRLPRARGQRLPPGAGQREHHRPVRGPGRAVRPRVRRHWPTAPSAARRSRAPSTRAARPASSCCWAPTRR